MNKKKEFIMDAGEETMWNANYVIKTRGGNGLGTRLHVWGWVYGL